MFWASWVRELRPSRRAFETDGTSPLRDLGTLDFSLIIQTVPFDVSHLVRTLEEMYKKHDCKLFQLFMGLCAKAGLAAAAKPAA